MDEIKELVTLDWKTVVIGIVVCAAFLKITVEFVMWMVKQFGVEFKHDREKKDEHNLLVKNIERIDLLEKEQEKIANTSRKYDKEIMSNVESLSIAIKELTEKVQIMADKQDATEQANLKDKIAQHYRKYTVEKQWTEMERESFMGLIRDYEAHGGSNSFVHKICEPESFTWKVVNTIPTNPLLNVDTTTAATVSKVDFNKHTTAEPSYIKQVNHP